MHVRLFLVLLALMFPAAAVSQTRPASTTLDIYVVDVEGGNAVLFVTPSGESVLIDSGNAGAGAVRDAERIVAAAKDAGLTKIDHLITTHYHGDHVGGLAELAARIPILEFIDHGPNVQPNPTTDAFLAGRLPGAVHQDETHGRETGRPDSRCRSGLACGDLRRAGRSGAVAGRGRAESLLRELHARRPASTSPRTISHWAA